MKKILFSTIILTSCFSEDFSNLYKKANDFENQGLYKEAMIIYKQIATSKIKEDNKYIINKSKYEDKEIKVDSISTMKKNFYNDQIDKTNDKESDKSLEQIISSDFNIYPYKKNYLLPVTYDFKEHDNRKQFETAFQLSAEKPIAYNFFGFNESISAAYTQKSFWQTSKNSSPFRETNYEPEIFIQFPYKNDMYLKGYKIALNHQSNGRDNELSRSWNRVYLEGYFQALNLFVIPRVWYRIPDAQDDNPDIEDFYGHGELSFMYVYKKHIFETMLRNNLEFNNKGAAELNWTFPLPKIFDSTNSYGLIQIFSGYGNSLIDYDREIHKIGFGIAFSR